jgi:hypothetical protein
VPRWSNPEIHVRYRPLDLEELKPIYKALAKKGDDPDLILDQNAAVLVKACIDVYAVLDGKTYSLRPGDPTGDRTKIDEDLAENLGVTDKRAVAVCRALFLTDFDLLNHARKLADFSGEAAEEVDKEFEGE